MPDPDDHRAVSDAQRAVDGPAARVLEDRYTDWEDPSGGGGGGVVATIPSPYPTRVDPGFVYANSKHPLRIALDVVSRQKAYSHLKLALVDLTKDPKKPDYAGYSDDQQMYVASTAKLAILTPALALREAVRGAADAIQAKDDVAFFKELNKAWSSEFRRFSRGGKDVNNSVPVLSRIFTAKRAKDSDPFTIDFTQRQGGADGFLEDMKWSLKSSVNSSSARCIRDLGFPYIFGVNKSAGFFTTKGLWVSLDYGGKHWDPSFTGSGQAATARSLAALLALVAQDRLVRPGLAAELRTLMAGEGQWASSDLESGIMARLPDAEKAKIEMQGKVGYEGGTFGDCAILRRKGPKDLKLAYIAVVLGGRSHDEVKLAGSALDDCVLLANGQAVKPPVPVPP